MLSSGWHGRVFVPKGGDTLNGILMKPDMIQAVREGSKTVTRRLSGLKTINEHPDEWLRPPVKVGGYWEFYRPDSSTLRVKPPYSVGEVCYIKEGWAVEKRYNHLPPRDIPRTAKIFYVADGVGEWPIHLVIGKLRSPLFTLSWAARYFIKITDVRPERLQEITPEDARLEGIDQNKPWGFPDGYINSFAWLWDSTYQKTKWDINPWVFRYSFRKVDKPT